MEYQWSSVTGEQRSILMGHGGEQGVFVRPSFVRVMKGDGNAAIIMQHMLYWSQTDMAKQREGWFYLTAQRMSQDTGLSHDVQERVRRKLVLLGVLEQKRAGVPAKNYYRINFVKLAELLIAESRKGEIKNQADTESSIRDSREQGEENVVNIEYTREDTVEHTTKNNYVRPGQKITEHVLGNKMPDFILWIQQTYPKNAHGIEVTPNQAARASARLGTLTKTNTREVATARVKTFILGIKNFRAEVDAGRYDRKYVMKFDKFAGLGVQYGSDPDYEAWARKKIEKPKNDFVV